MFLSRLWNWLVLCTAAILVFVGSNSADAGFGLTHPMTNTCPVLTQASVSPMRVSVGGNIEVSAVATDVDGDDIVYLWTGSGGSFADPAAPSTTFTCEAAGSQSITITVSDAGSCSTTRSAQVTCVE
ncbi:MAG: hypothetical protein WCE62_08135 [Polyangiales bacterium]